MRISETYTGNYFRASDFNQPRTFVVEAVSSVSFDDSQKPVVHLFGEKQRLALNKSNAFTLADAFGDETDGWIGKQIQVFAAPTFYQGKPVKGICVQPVTSPEGVEHLGASDSPIESDSSSQTPQQSPLRPDPRSNPGLSREGVSFQPPRIDYGS